MKITEPKTPYTPYEEGDDEYFNKLNEVNKAKPTEDILAQVINTLEKNPEIKDEEEDLIKKTMENTLANKYVVLIENNKKDKDKDNKDKEVENDKKE